MVIPASMTDNYFGSLYPCQNNRISDLLTPNEA
jgi:hypothetical protein